MDFIEKLFGLAPDGGSGLWELGIVLATIALAAGSRLRRARRAHCH